MPSNRIVKVGVNPHYFVGEQGEMLRCPKGWKMLLAGDASVTRAVKKLGPTWVVQHKRGKRITSKGVLAPSENISAAQELVKVKRSAPTYQKQLDQSRVRRQKKELEYVEDFALEVVKFLNFSADYCKLAKDLSRLIAVHATPVGSGTVARTKMIPIEERAKRATMAWFRHQTTEYDRMHIARVKGKRREVRRSLGSDSFELLEQYRTNRVVDTLLIEKVNELTKKL